MSPRSYGSTARVTASGRSVCAREGSRYRIAAACAPSRASLLTGTIHSLHGVTQTDGLAKDANNSEEMPAGTRHGAHTGRLVSCRWLLDLTAIRRAIKDVFGKHLLMHHSHRHKERNVCDLLPEAERPRIRQVWALGKASEAERQIEAVMPSWSAAGPTLPPRCARALLSVVSSKQTGGIWSGTRHTH